MNHFFLMSAALMAGSSLSWGEAVPSAPTPAANGATPTLEASSPKDQAIDQEVTQFIKDHKIDAQGPMAEKAPEAQKDEEKVTEVPASPEKDMIITNDDGVFFDLEKEGVVIYYKNVKVRSKKYNLTCDNELKVYLEPGEQEKKDDKKGKADEKKAPAKDDSEAESPAKASDMKLNFKDARRIVASGNVYVQGQDKDGKNIEAKADSVAFDVKTEEMLLTGGFPMLIADKVGVQCTKPGGSIRRLPNGNAIIKGETRTIIKDMDKFENRRNRREQH